MGAPIEVTTRYATTVDDLPAAWAFVMDRLDTVGPNPSVHITPLWSFSVRTAAGRARPAVDAATSTSPHRTSAWGCRMWIAEAEHAEPTEETR